ncbi:glycosyltransferase family 39 protein [Microbispora sp. NEAU-D428]|uniref:glycosyltransferase family 39 protein n=1 Tax=Microbispora sitophila TaxID=2771537 RepID=UPI001865E2B6|nr:glycosyltransferase family 39 protein [Microbispora sitophila]MBE3012571.1 glycosyltransferase family 39 protein [Microbispora sitophila]
MTADDRVTGGTPATRDDAGRAAPGGDVRAGAPLTGPPRAVVAIAAATVAVLLAVSPWYGYHRDELYFRMLGERPRLGYFDTPPLTPMIARVSTAIFGDTVVALRIVPALCAGALVVLVALAARELGGGRAAQILAAAGTATSVLPLVAGHALLTLTPDLVLWSAVTLCLLRVLLGGDGRYWLWVGALSGIAAYNRDLIVVLLGSAGLGILVAGPREVLRDRRLWAGALLALAIASPNLLYQATHDWPQFQMAEALRIDEGADNRATFVPLQIVLLGPAQAVVCVAGWLRLWRNRRVRSLAIAYPVACALVLCSGGRPDYTGAFLLYLFAAGCVTAAGWRRRGVLVAALAVDAVVAVVVALPVVPAASLAGTPVAAINEVARESVGMRDLAAQTARVVNGLPAGERAGAVLLAANYGEAGALRRWAGEFGLPAVYSGHNELWWWGPPPEGTRVVVSVGYPPAELGTVFARCTLAGRLSGMPGEEQGVPITVCRDPVRSWQELWPRTRHYS